LGVAGNRGFGEDGGQHVLLVRLGGLGGGGLGLRGGERVPAAEHLLQALRGVPGLRGVRLVDDDRHPLALDGGVLDHREFLQRGDDDLRPGVGEGRLELLRVLVDALQQALDVLEPGDGRLQLGVEHTAVGDDDDLVEDQLVGAQLCVLRQERRVAGGVQVGQAVSQPGDRVGLARPGGVLQEVALPCAVDGGVRGEPLDDVPLVVAGEQDLPRPVLGHVLLHVAVQQVQPGVAGPDLLPQVGGAVTVRVGRVALAALPAGAGRALVERQEDRVEPGELGGHEDQVGVYGEVRQAAAGEDPVGRVALLGVAVLRLGMPHGLPGELVLQLRGSDRDAVDGQHEVQRLVRAALAVVQLPVDQQPVSRVVLYQLGRQPVGGAEEGQLNALAALLDALSEDVDDAVCVHLVGDPLGELGLDRRPVLLDELGPFLRLRLLDEADDLDRVEAKGDVVVGR
jgi:hypothetical protein